MIYENKKVDNREFWQKHVRSWRESGMTQADYCRTHGLKNNRMTYYKLKDDKRMGTPTTARKNKISRAEKLFLPVKLASQARSSLLVTLANGLSMEFDNTSDPVWVGKILGSIGR